MVTPNPKGDEACLEAPQLLNVSPSISSAERAPELTASDIR